MDLLARLGRGEVVVGDGAWGTMLLERGLPPGDAPERVALERPELLTGIAEAYLTAGAELLTTDTFGASPVRLALHGLAERVEEVCCAAVAALRAAAGPSVPVSGSVGPLGRLLAPLGDLSLAEASAAFERQVGALADAGADLVCVETMSDLAEATLAVEASRRVAPGLPVVASMTFEPTRRGFFTVMGVSPAQAAAGLAAAGASVVGANCGQGVDAMVALARELRRASSLPIAVRPNAGRPELEGGVTVYRETPEVLAARVPELVEAGAALLGGCCGTSPAHVRAVRDAVARLRRR